MPNNLVFLINNVFAKQIFTSDVPEFTSFLQYFKHASGAFCALDYRNCSDLLAKRPDAAAVC
jgi:hypothetical protein